MSRAALVAMLAWAGSLDRQIRIDRGDGVPAYQPKRKKLKGFQKGQKRGKR